MKVRTASILVAVFATAGLVACDTNTRGNNSGAVSPAPSAVSVPASEPEITLAEFDQIKQGMTYDQVVKIIGVAGQVTSEYKAPPIGGQDFSSKTYTFHGATLGSSAVITFTGGTVSSTMQFGLT